MSQITIRKGADLDLRQSLNLLNEIIAIGGTTALTKPLTREDLRDWLMADPDSAAWHIAEDQDGTLLGFQWIGPWGDLPPEACEIGTFVKAGRTGLGIGSKLFEATKVAARAMGYDWIDAEIRADNTGGLTYYQSRGFEDYKRKDGIALDDGTIVSKCLKRYRL
ncbi:L-amino acid N-acyltransferase YncA [Shimia isoporae]|uniref:L-amino acid N-acyltransferase YncA n=1 Tax=Shimia isoporae TaxID=647720 RepID=A0A4R1N5K5_9RHOB|nr:GNAT family N-acetyltransferase [Shimia isoporae]TCK99785.1 L-amino acid N-acyltransferase YncA [Shimia isoporae]